MYFELKLSIEHRPENYGGGNQTRRAIGGVHIVSRVSCPPCRALGRFFCGAVRIVVCFFVSFVCGSCLFWEYTVQVSGMSVEYTGMMPRDGMQNVLHARCGRFDTSMYHVT